ncbi:hypothetical protein HanRHA438_Chr05g0203281 [Helianthus annuus]|nr:hypothetical protein HanRHA438_Chr05g0203281 [Helianthus annuus]
MFHLTQVTFFADGKYDGGASNPTNRTRFKPVGTILCTKSSIGKLIRKHQSKQP